MLRNLLLATFLGVVALYYYDCIPTSSFFPNIENTMSSQWSSPFSSWHARALTTPHPSPHTFTPTRESLLLAVLLNAPVETEGITLTIYSQPSSDETIAVDALGRVLLVSDKDSKGILSLARRTLDLPETGGWRNTWVIKQDRTSQPIDRIFIPSSSLLPGHDSLERFKQVSVQGFSKEKKELKSPINDITELPSALWELTGLVLEAREGSGDGERRDETVIRKVREVVGSLF